MKKNLLVSLIVLFSVVAIVFSLNLLRTQKQASSLDRILSLTTPVYSFSGTVESKNNNLLAVSENKKLTLNILVSEQTAITRTFSFIPYSFKTSQAPGSALAQTQLKIADIKAGDVIFVTASVDLRTLAKPEFEAVSISVEPGANSFSGVIADINGAIIKVKATIGGPAINSPAGQPTQKEFAVMVNDDTEISQPVISVNPLNPPAPKKLSLSDLEKDMQATFYIDGNINAPQPFTALLIAVSSVSASAVPVSTP